MTGVRLYNRYGRPYDMDELDAELELSRRMGALGDDTPHGLHPSQIDALGKRAEMKGLVYSPKDFRRSMVEDILPEGASLGPPLRKKAYGGAGAANSGSGFNGGGSSLFTSMRPYQPEFSSPDRQMFPIHRRQANGYWRMFDKMDPLVGSVIEMISELPWSDFQLIGEGVDGEPQEMMEYSLSETRLRSLFKHFVHEHFVVGEVIPHLFFDDSKGVWTHCALHNPDYINVIHSPFIKMDTIMEFVPDPALREIATSTHPMLARVRETMPDELIGRLRSGKNIPLSPVNASFIPRRLSPYDLRGTSILSRLWRTFMLEDAIWSATIETARRAAAPIKVAKLGDPTSQMVPPPSEEKRVLQMLAQMENDSQAWMVYNHAIQFDVVGAPERIMNINQHYDLIEKIKLGAIGVSKSFISGETSYSSAASGLTVFLQRLKSIRDFFVNEWLIPKYFMPMAVMNEWVKPSKAQAGGGYVRVKKSFRERLDENRYIVPEIEWEKTLDPTVDGERLQAMTSLEQTLGVKLSDQKKFAVIGLDHEEEQKQIIKELKFKRDLAGEDPLAQAALGLAAPEGMGGEGGMGGMMSPGIPPEEFGVPGGEGEAEGDMGGEPPLPPEGASIDADQGAQPTSPSQGRGTQPAPGEKSAHWSAATLAPIIRALETFDKNALADDEPWLYALSDPEVSAAFDSQDPTEIWSAIEQWLIDEGYPSAAIKDLQAVLTARKKLRDFKAKKDETLLRLQAQLAEILGEDEDVNLFTGARPKK